MLLTVLGGCGAWPTAAQACSGYLVESDGFTLLIDPGYGVLPRLAEIRAVGDVDAVLVSHAHPDHCADLSPLLRARALSANTHDVLPVFAPRGALDAVLALDPVRSVARAAQVERLVDGGSVEIGPFQVETAFLPHHVPNAGMRITSGDETLVYTGDSGHCSDRTALAKEADLLLAEATYVSQVPGDEAPYLSSATQVAELALEADAAVTLLTHLWPGSPTERALEATRTVGLTDARVATPGLRVDTAAYWTSKVGRRSAPSEMTSRSETPACPRRARSV